jgi:hypothetical protein
MKYHLTLINPEGIMLEETLDLPVSDDISWQDFTQLTKVKNLLLLNPTMKLHDVTPDGMPSWYTDEQLLRITLNYQGIRKTQNTRGATVYEDMALESTDLEEEA